MNPFLDKERFPDQRILQESEHNMCLYSPSDSLRGSVMIVPKLQRETLFDLTEEEWGDTRKMLMFAKHHLHQHAPDGFNVGWNCNPFAGQTIPWAHLHVIPRFADEKQAGKGLRWFFKQPENTRTHAE